MKILCSPIHRSFNWKLTQLLALVVIFGLFSCFLYTRANVNMLPAKPTDKYETTVLNEYLFPYTIPNVRKCLNDNGTGANIDLILVVKSAVQNFERRTAIRETWGLEHRFPGIVIRRVFNLGWITDKPQIQQQVVDEHTQNGDILQSAFVDSYYNNTIKTMMGLRWITELCPTAKFIMFVDDDMYISIKNVLRFVTHPREYPTYYQQKNNSENNLPATIDSSLAEIGGADFYAGFRMDGFGPHRDKSSKWYVSEADYPFPKYPSFVLAGVFIMSFQTLQKMYSASKHTRHLPFDDVYLGLVAKRAGIFPMHNEQFVNWRQATDYRFVISTHLYGDRKKLVSIWKAQEAAQNV